MNKPLPQGLFGKTYRDNFDYIFSGRRVVMSNLAARFYRMDGWTAELLEPCLEQGEFTLKHFDDRFGDKDMGYYILEAHARFDIDKLMPLVSGVLTFEGELVKDRDEIRKHLMEKNW